MKVNDAPRKGGRPRKREEEKAATAEIRKLRKQRRDEGVSARRDKPSAEMQLKPELRCSKRHGARQT